MHAWILTRARVYVRRADRRVLSEVAAAGVAAAGVAAAAAAAAAGVAY
jgi:hypothetical protein